MRIILGVTMRNEILYGPHVEWQIKDALNMDYDDIVILDDGSTDGTWEVLKEYELKETRLHVFRTEKNSILDDNGENRWITLVKHMSKFEPTWINVRAADQIYSKFYKEHMREVLCGFLNKNIHLIKFPLVHLWRSESWYRADNVWGKDLWNHNKSQVWRFNSQYEYLHRQKNAMLHKGAHLPAKLGFEEPINVANVNDHFEDETLGKEERYYPIMVLHYGHTTHEKKVEKFNLSMQQSGPKYSFGMPGPDNMPSPIRWLSYNGYKGFYEFNMELKPAPNIWFDEDYVVEPEPKIESFYEVILKYNKRVAEEYRELFNKHFHSKGKEEPLVTEGEVK